MAHHCDALVVSCIDFRLQKYIRNWLDKNLADKTFDYVGFAGGAKDIDTIMTQLKISVDLHSISEVILMNHEECGAYGAESTPENHARDLKKAKEIIHKKYPHLEIQTYYLHLDGTFESIQYTSESATQCHQYIISGLVLKWYQCTGQFYPTDPHRNAGLLDHRKSPVRFLSTAYYPSLSLLLMSPKLSREYFLGMQPKTQAIDFYARVMTFLYKTKTPFMIGGTHAFNLYTGVKRESKDLDIFIAKKMLPLRSSSFGLLDFLLNFLTRSG